MKPKYCPICVNDFNISPDHNCDDFFIKKSIPESSSDLVYEDNKDKVDLAIKVAKANSCSRAECYLILEDEVNDLYNTEQYDEIIKDAIKALKKDHPDTEIDLIGAFKLDINWRN